jgi:hypothetical protein
MISLHFFNSRQGYFGLALVDNLKRDLKLLEV